MKKFFLLLILLPELAFGQAMITEIMYDAEGSDTGREWIEVKNTGSTSILFSEWKLFEANTNHGLTLVSGDASIPSGGFAIIVSDPNKFNIDFPDFSGNIFDSSFSLSNTGETLSLKDKNLSAIDTVSYLAEWGAVGDGNTLQKQGASFIALSPTPGEETPVPTTTQTGTTTQNSPPPRTFPVDSGLRVDAGKNKTVLVGGDTLFDGIGFGIEGKVLTNARFLWNFGDGTIKEGEKVMHSYTHPGEYVVVLDISSGEYSASDRLIVKAIPADISITSITTDAITLSNNTDSELSLDGFGLSFGGKNFEFGENTFILPKAKVSFSSLVTGLSHPASAPVSLLYPNGTILATFSVSVPKTQVSNTNSGEKVVTPKATEKENPKNLSANVALSVEEENGGIDSSALIGLFAITFLAIIGVIFMKPRKTDGVGKLASSFEIIEDK